MTEHTDQQQPGAVRAAGVDWQALAQRLALALGYHRTDMHNQSNRPCSTCRFSQAVMAEYLAAAEHEQAEDVKA